MNSVDHLAGTFAAAEQSHPDLIEPYSSRLVEAEDASERAEIMRAGLRETFRRRYPMPDGFYERARQTQAVTPA